VKNTGPEPEDFFIDPRLNKYVSLTLGSLTSHNVPLPNNGAPDEFIVPTETSGIQVTQSSSVPAMFDYGTAINDPDLGSSSTTPGQLCSTSETGTYFAPGGKLGAGIWYAMPSECGPYSGAAPAGTATVSETVSTKAFDSTVSTSVDGSTIADDWASASAGTIDPTAVVVGPGQSVTFEVTITPSGKPGTSVTGTLYVDDLLAGVPPYLQYTGDEVAAIPYEYKVG